MKLVEGHGKRQGVLVCRLAVFYAVLAGLGEEALSVHSFERGNALDALSAAHWLGSGSSLGDALGRCPRRALRLLLGWRPETHSAWRLERL